MQKLKQEKIQKNVAGYDEGKVERRRKDEEYQKFFNE